MSGVDDLAARLAALEAAVAALPELRQAVVATGSIEHADPAGVFVGLEVVNRASPVRAAWVATAQPEEGQTVWAHVVGEVGVAIGTPQRTPTEAPGVIKPFAGDTPPFGYLLCDGDAVDRDEFAALFAVIGTAYGDGDGSTTFNLPDGRARFPVGADGTLRVLGDVGGSRWLPQHDHPGLAHSHTGPVHSHAVGTLAMGGSNDNVVIADTGSGTVVAQQAHIHVISGSTDIASGTTSSVTVDTDLSAADDVVSEPPWFTVNWIISTG